MAPALNIMPTNNTRADATCVGSQRHPSTLTHVQNLCRPAVSEVHRQSRWEDTRPDHPRESESEGGVHFPSRKPSADPTLSQRLPFRLRISYFPTKSAPSQYIPQHTRNPMQVNAFRAYAVAGCALGLHLPIWRPFNAKYDSVQQFPDGRPLNLDGLPVIPSNWYSGVHV